MFINLCGFQYRITTHPREGTCWLIHTKNLQYMVVIKGSQIVGHTQSIRNLFTGRVVLYYTKELCCTLSGICHMHITERRNKRKGLKGPSKYNFIVDPQKTRC